MTEPQLRRVLGRLRQPHLIDEPGLRELLVEHGRFPDDSSVLGVGREMVKLILEAIDKLRPAEDSTSHAKLPYRVLRTCFVQGKKNYQAAAELGLSERQLTRERDLAIRLLRDALTPVPATERAEVLFRHGGMLLTRGLVAEAAKSYRQSAALLLEVLGRLSPERSDHGDSVGTR